MASRNRECRYCHSAYADWSCKKCPRINTSNHCSQCHNELKHGGFTYGSVHFTGGGNFPKGTAGIEGDPDAFKRSS